MYNLDKFLYIRNNLLLLFCPNLKCNTHCDDEIGKCNAHFIYDNGTKLLDFIDTPPEI